MNRENIHRSNLCCWGCPSFLGWDSARPSRVGVGPSFAKGGWPILGDGWSALPSRGGGWPFLLGVGVGPSFSGWELPFGIAVVVGAVSRFALKPLELHFGVVVSLPSGGSVGPGLVLPSWSGS